MTARISRKSLDVACGSNVVRVGGGYEESVLEFCWITEAGGFKRGNLNERENRPGKY